MQLSRSNLHSVFWLCAGINLNWENLGFEQHILFSLVLYDTDNSTVGEKMKKNKAWKKCPLLLCTLIVVINLTIGNVVTTVQAVLNSNSTGDLSKVYIPHWSQRLCGRCGSGMVGSMSVIVFTLCVNVCLCVCSLCSSCERCSLNKQNEMNLMLCASLNVWCHARVRSSDAIPHHTAARVYQATESWRKWKREADEDAKQRAEVKIGVGFYVYLWRFSFVRLWVMDYTGH